MLGIATLAEARLAVYGALLVAISGWLVYEHHHLIAEGEARVIASDKAAVDRQAQAVAKQVAADKETSDAVVTGLQTELATLHAQVAAAPSAANRSVRCYSQRSGTVPSQTGVTPSPPAPDARQPLVASVPHGASDLGPDIWAGLQLLAQAGGVAAAYQRACAAFALRTEGPTP